MKRKEAHEYLCEYVEGYFTNATVIFSKQSRAAKPKLPVVAITPGNSERIQNPNYEIIGMGYETYYQIKEDVVIDLFTHGTPVLNDDGQVIAYEDSSVEELTDFINHINKKVPVDWATNLGISFIADGKVEESKELLDKGSYGFHAKTTIQYCYNEEAEGYKNTTGGLWEV